MDIGEIYSNDQFKILKAEIPAGQRIPTHTASSEAFLVVVQGKAQLIFSDTEVSLEPGSTYRIPVRKPHSLDVIEALEAFIVRCGEGRITFASHLAGQLRGSTLPG